MQLPATRFSRAADAIIERIGTLASWLWAVLLVVIVANVVMRYAFSLGRIEFEELQWHLYSAGFLIAMSFAVNTDSHIRVDVVRARLSERVRAWIELYGLMLLLLPFVTIILIHSTPFVINSFLDGEVSSSPGGLPYRWLIKAMLLVGFGLLALAALSRLTRIWAYLFK